MSQGHNKIYTKKSTNAHQELIQTFSHSLHGLFVPFGFENENEEFRIYQIKWIIAPQSLPTNQWIQSRSDPEEDFFW